MEGKALWAEGLKRIPVFEEVTPDEAGLWEGRLIATYELCLGRRQWQPTPVFLPGESQGQGSLVGCRLWGCTESDTTEATQ